MSSTTDKLYDLVVPLLESNGLELYDLEFGGGTLRVTVDSVGGADMGAISAVTRAISVALDDQEWLQSSYTLEVSSPGIERTLRTKQHFDAVIGQQAQIKVRNPIQGQRRFVATILEVADRSVTVSHETLGEIDIPFTDIQRARIHVDWDELTHNQIPNEAES